MLPLEQLLSFFDEPAPNPCFTRGFYESSVSVIQGPAECEKWDLALGLVLGVATGEDVIPFWNPSDPPAPVLILSASSPELVRLRMKDLGGKSVDLSNVVFYPHKVSRSTASAAELNLDAEAGRLREVCTNLHPRMILIDPLMGWFGGLAGGAGDGREDPEAPILRALLRMSHELQTCIVAVRGSSTNHGLADGVRQTLSVEVDSRGHIVVTDVQNHPRTRPARLTYTQTPPGEFVAWLGDVTG